jgi:acetyl-CoA carboxylase alpha subunit
MIVGQQKDITRRPIQKLRDGKSRRISKALRLMKMAEKFGIPVLTLIDTQVLIQGWKRKNADKVRLSPEIYLKWFV